MSPAQTEAHSLRCLEIEGSTATAQHHRTLLHVRKAEPSRLTWPVVPVGAAAVKHYYSEVKQGLRAFSSELPLRPTFVALRKSCLARSAASVGQESLLCLTQHESILGTEGNGVRRPSSHINAQNLIFYALPLARAPLFPTRIYTNCAEIRRKANAVPRHVSFDDSMVIVAVGGSPTGLHRSRLLDLIPTPIHEACPIRMPITECSR
jgi:hypothetical protein